jgi:hypothetical protein
LKTAAVLFAFSAVVFVGMNVYVFVTAEPADLAPGAAFDPGGDVVSVDCGNVVRDAFKPISGPCADRAFAIKNPRAYGLSDKPREQFWIRHRSDAVRVQCTKGGCLVTRILQDRFKLGSQGGRPPLEASSQSAVGFQPPPGAGSFSQAPPGATAGFQPQAH